MLMEDFHGILVPRFVAAALARLHEARLVAGTLHTQARAKVVADLRRIASEAQLLGLTTVAKLAAACEQRLTCGDDSAAALDELEHAIESI
jgi:hypothetical protein